MVSSPYYGIGTWLYVYGVNTDRLEWCRVTDVSATRDRARHIRTGRVAELGYGEAERLCSAAALNKRPERCPVTVLRIEGEP